MDAAIVKETGWTYQQIYDQPVDWLFDMVGAWNAEAEHSNNEMEKARHR